MKEDRVTFSRVANKVDHRNLSNEEFKNLGKKVLPTLLAFYLFYIEFI